MLDKAVFDTNILLSKILSNQLNTFIELLISHSVEAYTCEQQLDEIVRNLAEKRLKKFLSHPPEFYADFIRMHFINQKIDTRFDRGPVEDNYLVDLAFTVKSQYIISGDHELRLLKHVGKIQIVSFWQWKKLLLKQ